MFLDESIITLSEAYLEGMKTFNLGINNELFYWSEAYLEGMKTLNHSLSLFFNI